SACKLYTNVYYWLAIHKPVPRVGRLVSRQADRERGALAWSAFDFDGSAVEIDDAPGLGEAEAKAAAGFAAGEERVEDVGANFGRNAGGGVGDGQDKMRSAECGAGSGEEVRSADCGLRNGVKMDRSCRRGFACHFAGY